MKENQSSIRQIVLLSERLRPTLSSAGNEDDFFNKTCQILGGVPRSAAAVLRAVDSSDKYRVAYTSVNASALKEFEQVTGIALNFLRIDVASSPTLTRILKQGKTILSPTVKLVEELFGYPVTTLIKDTWTTHDSVFIAGVLPPNEILIASGPYYTEETLDFAGMVIRQVATLLQITRLKQKLLQQEELYAREHEALNALMDYIPDNIYFKDCQSRFISCNRAQAQLVGLSNPMEIVGKTDFDFFPNEMASHYFSSEKKLFKTGTPIIDQEELVKNVTGNDLWFSTTKVPICNSEGKIEGLVGISREITQRKKDKEEKILLEEQLTQSHKLESLGQLAGGIAHDFNNMLGAISGYANMIRRRAANSDPYIQDHAQIILDASRRAADLTGKLLAFARKGKYMVVIVNVHDTIQDVIKLLTHTINRNITIKQHLTAVPPTVMGDRTQLQNVILNLAVNARDAMPEGGELSFSTDVLTVTNRTLSRYPHIATPGKYLIFSVADTGTGIDEETRVHIFEPFFTTKEKGHGTGLGLASVYGTVKNHQGAIEVTTEPGKGTRFDVFLPLVESEEEILAPEKKGLTRGSGMIMVVDDEPLIRDVATEMLEHLGYNVVTCNDGVEAIEYYRKNGETIDLLIVDMIMPRMGGADCILKIRALNENARIIISTGYSMTYDTQKIMAKGVAGFIEKPFEEKELSELIAHVLKG